MSIGRKTVADDLGINLGAALLGVFIVFKDQNTGSFAEHKTVTILIERTGCRYRIVVSAGQGMHIVKAAYAQRANRAFSTAGNHDVGVSAANHPGRFTDAVQAGCAGCGVSQGRTLQIAHDGELSGDHVGNRAGNQERRDAAFASFHIRLIILADNRQTADSAADRATCSLSLLTFKSQAAVIQCLDSCSNT